MTEINLSVSTLEKPKADSIKLTPAVVERLCKQFLPIRTNTPSYPALVSILEGHGINSVLKFRRLMEQYLLHALEVEINFRQTHGRGEFSQESLVKICCEFSIGRRSVKPKIVKKKSKKPVGAGNYWIPGKAEPQFIIDTSE